MLGWFIRLLVTGVAAIGLSGASVGIGLTFWLIFFKRWVSTFFLYKKYLLFTVVTNEAILRFVSDQQREDELKKARLSFLENFILYVIWFMRIFFFFFAVLLFFISIFFVIKLFFYLLSEFEKRKIQ